MASMTPELEGYILDGMARALWVHAYMIWATEVEPPPTLHGESWDEVAPNNKATRAASLKAAKSLTNLYAEANKDRGLVATHPLASLFDEVEAADTVPSFGSTAADRAYGFGEELAHLAMGTRDRQDGAARLVNIAVPYFKVELDDDGRSITWDGGWNWEPGLGDPGRWTPNPRRVPKRATSTTGAALPRPARAATPHPLVVPAMSSREFAQAVQDILPTIDESVGPDGRPGGRPWQDNKVFIGSAWRALKQDPRFHGMTIEQFKRRLVEANRDELLTLARADTTGEFDPSEVEESEIVDNGHSFHFVVDRRHRPPWARNPAMNTKEFAELVNAELPYIVAETGPEGKPRGRFGDRKVFIAALWRQLRTHPRLHHISLPNFKQCLYEAHRARLVQLARADLVAAMDNREVADSEYDADGAQFHFVVDRTVGNPASNEDLALYLDQILDAYLACTHGHYGTRCRLADLRNEMRGTRREVLDEMLRRLSMRGQIALFPLDDRIDITERDRKAALVLSDVPQHLLYISKADLEQYG